MVRGVTDSPKRFWTISLARAMGRSGSRRGRGGTDPECLHCATGYDSVDWRI
jgi:hypothetical protein